MYTQWRKFGKFGDGISDLHIIFLGARTEAQIECRGGGATSTVGV